MKTAILQTLGDRAVEEEKMRCFHLLWEIGWGARFDAGLPDWIGAKVMDSISRDLNQAARKGLEAGFRTVYDDVPEPTQELIISQFMEEVWDNNSAVDVSFPNWIQSGWLASSTTGADHDRTEEALSACNEALDQAWCATIQAMQITYGSAETTETHDTISHAISGIINCRENLHTIAIIPLTQPDVNDETGLGPYFGMLTFQEGDSFLSGLHHIVRRDAFPEEKAQLLEDLIQKERAILSQLSNGYYGSGDVDR